MDSEIDFGLKVPYIQGGYRYGRWDYIDPETFRGYVSDKELKEIESSRNIPYCTSCGNNALFEKQDNGEYTFCLSNFCPKCGAILNPKLVEFVHNTVKQKEVEQKAELESIKIQLKESREYSEKLKKCYVELRGEKE